MYFETVNILFVIRLSPTSFFIEASCLKSVITLMVAKW